MTIRAVAAYQAPALFNILATSTSWDLKMAPLGDHEDLAEMAELSVPTWGEADPAPDVVLVCSPAQFETAKKSWPDAKYLWVVHNGYERWLLPLDYEDKVDGAICFSEKNRWLQQVGRKARFFFVRPAYTANPVWTWAPNRLWTLRNRPANRRDDVDIVLSAITEDLGYVCYGQDQAAGVADTALKTSLKKSCSAYVSALQRTAGFGLAEHEAMAAGVPVIGGWWGDIDAEMDSSYWGLVDDIRAMKRAARKVVDSPGDALRLSWLGLEYIRRCRKVEWMNESIADLLQAVM